VRVAIVTREVMPEGGLALASFRLAAALAERGEEARVLYSRGEPPAELAEHGRRLGGGSPGSLRRELERAGPDVVLVGSGEIDDLRAAAAVAPTLLHAHLHTGICADDARYWARAGRACGVKAGWGCAALRPLLGCGDLKRSLDPRPVAAQRRLLELLAGGGVGVACVSSDQAELYGRHGVPPSSITVLPNLGMRASPMQLEAAARSTPVGWRNATAFVGRLSKPKGAQLLAGLAAALGPEQRLRVFGDGYLAPSLRAKLGAEALCGHVGQDRVLGVLMWARAAVVPSLWPEPGGIVGVDAQLAGVPLAAFAVGAPRYWPAARRFAPRDVAAMAAWLAAAEPRRGHRDPEAVAAAQARYWDRVAERAATRLGGFAAGRGFAVRPSAPAEELIAA
jgi:glycosyltransferase involved in cell wall biosynthesis